MPKKCVICGEQALFMVRGSSDFYCGDCAEDYFSDINLLEEIAEKAEKEVSDGQLQAVQQPLP